MKSILTPSWAAAPRRGWAIAIAAVYLTSAACGSDSSQDTAEAMLPDATQRSQPATPTTGMPYMDTSPPMAVTGENPAVGAAGAPAPQVGDDAEPAEQPAEDTPDTEGQQQSEQPADGEPPVESTPGAEGQQEPEQPADDEPPAPGDTWNNFGQGFVDTYCVGCHPGLLSPRDYTTYDGITADADAIRCGVAPTLLDGCSGTPAPAQFPAGAPYPSDEERLQLVAWIEAGMPQ